MTKKNYEIDSYMKECMATVKNIKLINDDYWVSLDQTIFYPEGGGQPSDIGTIDGIPVLDVKFIDTDVYHRLNSSIEKSRVKLKIDYSRRFDHMQQHSGQHLLSAVWLEMFQIRTVSFHLGKEICTIDLEASEITAAQIEAVENQLSQYIFENRVVESYILPYEEVDESKLVKLKEKPAFVRFIEIDGIDSSTCCGTHVSMLGEIGIIKIIGSEKYKQNIRLTFVCGKRAASYFQIVFNAANEVSKKLNITPVLVADRFPAFYQGYQQLKKAYQNLYEKEIHHEAKELAKNELNGIIEVIWEDRPLQEMKDLAKIIIQAGDKIVFLNNQKENTWIFASSSSHLFNVATCIQSIIATFGGKGGGSTVFGQWTGKIDQTSWEQLKKQLLK